MPDPEPLTRVCAWCQIEGRGPPPAVGQTHGICAGHYREIMAGDARPTPSPREERPMPSDKRPGLPDDPAFACSVPADPDAEYYEGLSAREYFAGQALARLAGQFADQLGEGGAVGPTGAQRCAAACVRHADALLAALAEATTPPEEDPANGK